MNKNYWLIDAAAKELALRFHALVIVTILSLEKIVQIRFFRKLTHVTLHANNQVGLIFEIIFRSVTFHDSYECAHSG